MYDKTVKGDTLCSVLAIHKCIPVYIPGVVEATSIGPAKSPQ